MGLKIPNKLFEKANTFPESSYGATTVTLMLSDGRLIDEVVLGGASDIVKIKGRFVSDAGDLDFSMSDIVDIAPDGAGLSKLIFQLTALIRRVINKCLLRTRR